ncbi:MAG TPA: R3H domain-containing nucleic acid-binding protein [Candidatus Acidoferrales bacterium]|jgi:spoIIIJ-associated protein|nr:R3H domain-containing nucleic acid-binding protein [Candidatus Acidoferrales bacterium]
MQHRFLKDGKLDRAPLIAELRSFLDLLLARMRLDMQYEIREVAAAEGPEAEHAEVLVVFRGRDQEYLLQHHAELLTAVEYLAHRCLHLDPQFYDHVQFDCADVRATRLAELQLSAKVAAQRVLETRQEFRFNPMSARERRVIHLAVKDVPGVRSASDGAGDHRHVVLRPA